MKGTDRGHMLGAVVGKALEPLQKGTGVIQVLVTFSRDPFASRQIRFWAVAANWVHI